jgi:hypothetical protein
MEKNCASSWLFTKKNKVSYIIRNFIGKPSMQTVSTLQCYDSGLGSDCVGRICCLRGQILAFYASQIQQRMFSIFEPIILGIRWAIPVLKGTDRIFKEL